MKKKILIFGGSGYVGSNLLYQLLKKYHVINYDLNLFGSKHLPYKNKNFTMVKGDVRDIKRIEQILKKFNPYQIIHLACISNDPSFLLNKTLSKEINLVAFKNLIKLLEDFEFQKFLFVSTCSVYGVSKKKNITEKHPLKAITQYNKYKGDCEKILLDRKNNLYKTCIIRPATVCGVSRKMRFDLSVNILTNFAYHKKFINVFGGEQKRPNVHIDDVVNFYDYLSEEDFTKCNNESFNFGEENLKIIEIAKKVKKIVEKIAKYKININVTKSNDMRSYHVNSEKYKKFFKFRIKKTVDDAIYELCNYFKKNKINDSFSNPNYHNVKKLIKINLK